MEVLLLEFVTDIVSIQPSGSLHIATPSVVCSPSDRHRWVPFSAAKNGRAVLLEIASQENSVVLRVTLVYK